MLRRGRALPVAELSYCLALGRRLDLRINSHGHVQRPVAQYFLDTFRVRAVRDGIRGKRSTQRMQVYMLDQLPLSIESLRLETCQFAASHERVVYPGTVGQRSVLRRDKDMFAGESLADKLGDFWRPALAW